MRCSLGGATRRGAQRLVIGAAPHAAQWACDCLQCPICARGLVRGLVRGLGGLRGLRQWLRRA